MVVTAECMPGLRATRKRARRACLAALAIARASKTLAILRLLLAAVFVGAAFEKLRDLGAFESVLHAHLLRITGVPPVGGVTYHGARFLIVIELCLGIGLLTGFLRARGILLPVVFLTAVTAVHVAASVLGKPLPCGCGVPILRADSWQALLLRNGILISAATRVCWREWQAVQDHRRGAL